VPIDLSVTSAVRCGAPLIVAALVNSNVFIGFFDCTVGHAGALFVHVANAVCAIALRLLIRCCPKNPLGKPPASLLSLLVIVLEDLCKIITMSVFM